MLGGQIIFINGLPVAGSGKTTWALKHISPLEKYVSRDEVRFSMVTENEEYFSKEKEVFKKFTDLINTYLDTGFNVYADATHLNQASRNKLLRAISSKPEEVNVIWIKTPLEEALKRNENRKGTRAYVPRSVVRRMHYSIESPSFEEGFNVIYIIEDKKPIHVIYPWSVEGEK